MSIVSKSLPVLICASLINDIFLDIADIASVSRLYMRKPIENHIEN